MACTCGPNEACSECPRDLLGETREAVLRYVNLAARNKLPADQVRNLATAYGILSDKHFIEQERPASRPSR